MASLQDCLTVARSGILTHQERLSVISNNIVNVNTEGYHRRQAVLGTNPAIDPTMLETRDYPISTGVTVLDVVRSFNNMKESLLLGEMSSHAYHEQMSEALGDVEALMVGAGDASLSAHLAAFWSAWQDLANNADNIPCRNVLIERSASLADFLHTLSDRLSTYRSAIASGSAPPFAGIVPDEVAEINRIASEIQDLNSRISYSLSDFTPHDLMDRRDQLIRELSAKTDMAVGADFTITIDGELLVSGDGATRNDLTVSGVAGPITFTLAGNPVTIAGGSLGAWTAAAATVDTLDSQLDALAAELISAVNSVHNSDLSATGDSYDLDGNRCDWNFFTGADASDIAVNPLIYDPANPLSSDPRLIAAAATRYSAGPPPVANPGDGAKALEIADLAYRDIVALNNMTFDEYYSGGLGSLGAIVESESDLAADSASIIDMLADSIQAETGVNLDEEMVEMIAAQRAYEASMRLFVTIDSMLEEIINQLGA